MKCQDKLFPRLALCMLWRSSPVRGLTYLTSWGSAYVLSPPAPQCPRESRCHPACQVLCCSTPLCG